MSYIVEPLDGHVFRTAHGKCSQCGAVGFHTKNIDHFGARTISTFQGGCEFMRKRNNASECHDQAPLEVDWEAHKHIANCKICQEYGF